MLSIDRFIHRPHIIGADASRKRSERILDLRPSLQRLFAEQGDRLVRRKIMPIVIQHRQPKGLNGAVCRVARNHIHLVRIQRTIQ